MEENPIIRYGMTLVGRGKKYHYLPPDAWRMTACGLVSGIVFEYWTEPELDQKSDEICRNCQGWLQENRDDPDYMMAFMGEF